VRVRADGSAWITGVGPGVHKINPDGTYDATWVMGTGATNGSVNDLAELADGKVMIAGGFTAVSGHGSRRLARLNANGSVDTGFSVGTTINGNITRVLALPEGKVLIGGQFTTIGGVSRVGVARLNADGTLDTTFDPGTGTMGVVSAGSVLLLHAAPGGKYIVGGLFNNYNGSGKGSLVRVNNDGSFDTTWALENTFMTIPYDITPIQGGGWMLAYAGDAKMVRRLSENGVADPTFDTVYINGQVTAVAMQADGKAVITGQFTQVNFVSRPRLTRLNTDGTLDTGYFSASGPSANVAHMGQWPNGDLLIAGSFTTVQGADRVRVAKLFGETPASVSVERGPTTPAAIELHPAYPNPFNPSTQIGFRLSGAHAGTPLHLAIYDILGREVAVLVDGAMPAGSHSVTFDASGLASGVYLVRLEADGMVRTRSISLIK
jgi:uncharacterized delta-60 repeat protein